MRILIVEDDNKLAANLRELLKRSSYAVDVAGCVKDGYARAIDEEYDLLIIDRNLPDGDGASLVKKLRDEETKALIMILTAQNGSTDTVNGLDMGADDYVGKPFSFSELLARIRALTRRADRIPIQPLLMVDDLEIDANTHSVTRAGKRILLAPREYAILEYLARHTCQVVNRMSLISHAWDENADLFSNSLDVHIRNLRRKIDDGSDKPLIKTVKGIGYMICGQIL